MYWHVFEEYFFWQRDELSKAIYKSAKVDTRGWSFASGLLFVQMMSFEISKSFFMNQNIYSMSNLFHRRFKYFKRLTTMTHADF